MPSTPQSAVPVAPLTDRDGVTPPMGLPLAALLTGLGTRVFAVPGLTQGQGVGVPGTRDGRFFVRTDGPDGKLADFEIR